MCRTLQTRWQEPQTAPDLHAPTHEPGSGIVGGTTGVSGMTPRRRAPSRADLANTRTRATDDLHRSRHGFPNWHSQERSEERRVGKERKAGRAASYGDTQNK